MIHCFCGLAYVGKTTRKLKQRMSYHKSSKYRNDSAVHFSDTHQAISSLRFCGMEQVNLPPGEGDNVKQLKQLEANRIHILQTLAPKGVNDELLLSMFL